MGKGILIGVIWGMVFTVIVLVAVSLNAPLPQRATGAATEPVLAPAPAPAPAGSPGLPGQPAPDTAPAQPQPAAERPAISGPVSPPPPAGTDPAAEAPPGPAGQTNAPGQAVPLPEGSGFNRPAPGQPALPAPQVPQLPEGETQGAAPSPQAQGMPASRGPVPFGLQGQSGQGAEGIEVAGLPAVRLGLPQIGSGAARILPAPSGSGPGLPATGGAASPSPSPIPVTARGALAQNALGFDPAGTRPLLAIVLVAGPGGITPEGLGDLPFALGFALDPATSEVGAMAAMIREAGHEVLVMADGLPQGAAPAQIRAALQDALAMVPQAVALIDSAGGRLQGDPLALGAALDTLSQSGHGLLAYPRGLNGARQAAARLGVPAAILTRVIEAPGGSEGAPSIANALDRASFAAGQTGSAIALAPDSPAMRRAIRDWVQATGAGGVALAPVSAVLLRG